MALARAMHQLTEELKMKALNYMTAAVTIFVGMLYAVPVIAEGFVNIIYAIA